MSEGLRDLIGINEKILWEGKPNKIKYKRSAPMNFFLIFVIIWASIDSILLLAVLLLADKDTILFFIPFMLLHSTPVWIYLIINHNLKKGNQNLYYVLTDKAIYIEDGSLKKKYISKSIKDLKSITVEKNKIDNTQDLGNIICTFNDMDMPITLLYLNNYNDIYNKINELTELKKD